LTIYHSKLFICIIDDNLSKCSLRRIFSMEKRKSLITILMVAVFALSLANCSSEEKVEDTSATTPKVENKCTQGDCKEGAGVMEFSNGDKYEGSFKGAKLEGEGAYIFANGDSYKGLFANDKFNGKGTYTYANGDKYEGDFKDDLYDGKGIYTTKGGNKYDGEFKAGKMDGKGTLTSAKGVYTGAFVADLPNGKGVLKNKDGKVVYEGDFVNGQPSIIKDPTRE
jgi:hypothetical protein